MYIGFECKLQHEPSRRIDIAKWLSDLIERGQETEQCHVENVKNVQKCPKANKLLKWYQM